MKLRTLQLTLVVITLLFGRNVTLEGQNTTGSIVGTITDATGAAIPRAHVAVLNLDTQESREVIAQDSGDFDAQLLKPGNYSVTVLAPGFRQVVTSGIVVQVGRTVRENSRWKLVPKRRV